MSDTKKSSFSQLKITLEQVHEYNHQISKHIAVMLRNYKVEKEAGQNDQSLDANNRDPIIDSAASVFRQITQTKRDSYDTSLKALRLDVQKFRNFITKRYN